MIKVQYVLGDITQITADAIITPINPAGYWAGGVDMAIKKVAGEQYHQQAKDVLKSVGLKDKDVVVAKWKTQHLGQFKNVIFVTDDLVSPLNEIILEGLKAAKNQGYKNVSLPLMRTGLMAGFVEKTLWDVIKQMDLAFGTFTNQADMDLTVVIYDRTCFNEVIKTKTQPG